MHEWGRYLRGGLLVWVGIAAAFVGCRAVPTQGWVMGGGGASEQVVRGAAFYGAYCSGCHGTDGSERGPLAEVLDVDPPDLRAPGLLDGVSDTAILERLRSGAPLSPSSRDDPFLDEARLRELERYIARLDRTDWDLVRVGRFVFEADCASCHGVYGDGDSIYPGLPQTPPPDLATARERYTDEALAVVMVEGKGAMPRLVGDFEPMEMRGLVAYVRHLSPG